jgi:sec-independent protein translocase protein TatB
MFGMGMGEIMVILVVALLVLGPDKIPEAAKSIGKVIRDLRKQTRGVQEQLSQDTELSSTVAEIKSALTGEEPPRPPAPRILPPKVKPVTAQGALPTPPATPAGLPETPAVAVASPPAETKPEAKAEGDVPAPELRPVSRS